METLGFMFFDLNYLLYLSPAILLALWAQMKLKAAYGRASRHAARCGLTGAQAAQRILSQHGIVDVAIEQTRGHLGDHYDPRHRVLRLSPDVYSGRSLASLGIAAHEVGHAIQHATSYAPLAIRGALVPTAMVGTQLSWIMIIGGLVLSGMHIALGQPIAVLGIVLFGGVVLFQLVNLPVEFDASRRARQILLTNGMIVQDEEVLVGKVLNAAALTYVAATLTAILQLAYYVSLVMNRRD
ncbi:MAG: zinc metallopeptidase [Planctomycetota bacterium]